MSNTRPHGQPELQELFAFMWFKKDTLFRNSATKHFVLGFKKLDLATQVFFKGSCKQKQQGLENLTHRRYYRAIMYSCIANNLVHGLKAQQIRLEPAHLRRH